MPEVIDFLTKKKLINDNDLPIQTIHKLIEGLKGQLEYDVRFLRSKGIEANIVFQVSDTKFSK